MGYSPDELEQVQDRWTVRFPPDLHALLLERRAFSKRGFDWLTTHPRHIEDMFRWPLEGFWFDVEENGYWWQEWGAKPADPDARRRLIEEVFATAPRLIPLSGHRYLPAEPSEAGNPVFSVYQTDVICYGSDLADWLERERNGYGDGPGERKEIRFWSEVVRRNI